MGALRGLRPGLDPVARRIRRVCRARSALAERRRLFGQSAARQKGGPGAAQWTGANPTDRGKCGTKRHLLTDGKGVPLATIVSEANRTDMKRLAALLDARMIEMPALPDDTPDAERPQLCLDRGSDYAACRETARAHGYVPHISPKAT